MVRGPDVTSPQKRHVMQREQSLTNITGEITKVRRHQLHPVGGCFSPTCTDHVSIRRALLRTQLPLYRFPAGPT